MKRTTSFAIAVSFAPALAFLGLLACGDSAPSTAPADTAVAKPLAATQLAFRVEPRTTEAGLILTPVQVTALNYFGNRVTDFTGTIISLALSANPSGASLSGTTTVAAERGVAEFRDLRIDQPGRGYTLVATASGLSDATSDAFDMTAVAENGQIAFESTRDGDTEIYLMNADGSGVIKLTDNSVEDRDPTWSPDGSRIAFARGPYGSAEIYVMNASGENAARLTEIATDDYGPAWSPDGTRIAFVSTRDGNAEIYVMNADGTSPVRLTSDNAYDSDPAWSPDGSRIAFGSNRGGIGGIWVMNADGSGLRRLTSNNPDCGFDVCPGDWQPAWSPDGTRIAFSHGSSSGGYEYRHIFIVNADGSGLTQLTHGIYDDAAKPAWSPDGRKIALAELLYRDDLDLYYHIQVVTLDGIPYPSLTPLAESSNPAWRP